MDTPSSDKERRSQIPPITGPDRSLVAPVDAAGKMQKSKAEGHTGLPTYVLICPLAFEPGSRYGQSDLHCHLHTLGTVHVAMIGDYIVACSM